MNAKNGMGGYVGFEPFFYIAEVQDRTPPDDTYLRHWKGEFKVVSEVDPLKDLRIEAFRHLCGGAQIESDDQIVLTDSYYEQKRMNTSPQHLMEQAKNEAWYKAKLNEVEGR